MMGTTYLRLAGTDEDMVDFFYDGVFVVVVGMDAMYIILEYTDVGSVYPSL